VSFLVGHFSLHRFDPRPGKVLHPYGLGARLRTSFHGSDGLWVLSIVSSLFHSLSWNKIGLKCHRKKARIITFAALIGRDFFGFIIGVFFPIMGLQAHAFYGLAIIYMCFLLTYGLLRMQWEIIQDFRDGLEEKVALRTTELKDVNERLGKAQVQISKYIDPNIDSLAKSRHSGENRSPVPP
jgi:hypothetical protein